MKCKHVENDSVLVTWENETQSVGVATHYAIERARKGTEWSRLTVLQINTTSYCDKSVVPGKVYSYRVKCLNEAGESEPSSQTDYIRAKCEFLIVRFVLHKHIVKYFQSKNKKVTFTFNWFVPNYFR